MKFNEQAMKFSKNMFSFEELFNLSELQKMQDTFSELTGFGSVITLPNGTLVTQPSNFCNFCNHCTFFRRKT